MRTSPVTNCGTRWANSRDLGVFLLQKNSTTRGILYWQARTYGSDSSQVVPDNFLAKNFRVRPQEMAILKANTTNRVRMLNGDYLGGMQVYHSLHCLNEIRKKVHWDYYGAPKTEDEINAHKEHIGKLHSSVVIIISELFRSLYRCDTTIGYVPRKHSSSQCRMGQRSLSVI